MMSERAEQLTNRTNAKLRYARVHLEELEETPVSGRSQDYGRAHLESFFYHLFGAKDAFLHELSDYYGCGLSKDGITLGKIRNTLKERGEKSPEVAEIYLLQTDSGGWLHHAKTMRDYATHISGVPLSHYAGGERDGETLLVDPESGAEVGSNFVAECRVWLHEMTKLLERLRASAKVG